jgi:hypothetical protein
MKMTITITYSHPIDAASGRADSKPRANFLGHDDRARDFLFDNVRGYRGPSHPSVTAPYARKIEALATAAGIKVTVVKRRKPTPAYCNAAAEAFRRWVQTVSP